jgi:DNA invertase Pin-like site-specific DNA recombinase
MLTVAASFAQAESETYRETERMSYRRRYERGETIA